MLLHACAESSVLLRSDNVHHAWPNEDLLVRGSFLQGSDITYTHTEGSESMESRFEFCPYLIACHWCKFLCQIYKGFDHRQCMLGNGLCHVPPCNLTVLLQDCPNALADLVCEVMCDTLAAGTCNGSQLCPRITSCQRIFMTLYQLRPLCPTRNPPC